MEPSNIFNGPEANVEKNRGLSESTQQGKATFGRHVAHKHHDTMGDILRSHSGFGSSKFKHQSDFNRSKEVINSDNGDEIQDITSIRHRAHKPHDTMREIIHNNGDAVFGKFKYNHDSDLTDKQVNKINSEHVDEYQADAKDQKDAHKHHDTIGDTIPDLN
ncbi:Hypothetical protein CINCED_3A007261 [Cinara cedri]|uniref:Uncharacterized protein n=1 Tax=Cinara cedri TaxID=506608 RepID=A0A5E4MDE1_9HEMI|nr:Hypothetical protein CINCED_3A007261 [Cinara cedri]